MAYILNTFTKELFIVPGFILYQEYKTLCFIAYIQILFSRQSS
jgi:hypothetical protein